MTIEFKIQVTDLRVSKLVGTFTNVVASALWVLTATDGEKTVAQGFETKLDSPNTNFIEFNELSESQIIQWIKNSIGEKLDSEKGELIKKFNIPQFTEQNISVSVPWSN
jgi:hypothetical protein